MPEIIDPVFAKTSQNARFLLSENERFGLVFVKTGSINSGKGRVRFVALCYSNSPWCVHRYDRRGSQRDDVGWICTKQPHTLFVLRISLGNELKERQSKTWIKVFST